MNNPHVQQPVPFKRYIDHLYICTVHISQVEGGAQSLSGQQGLDLLGRPRHQLLRVFVAVSRAAQRRVDLAVGSAHQLCGLAEDVLPARTHHSVSAHISTPGGNKFLVSIRSACPDCFSFICLQTTRSVLLQNCQVQIKLVGISYSFKCIVKCADVRGFRNEKELR